MNYQEGLSADMEDLFKPDKRPLLIQFADHFFWAINEKRTCEIKYGPIKGKPIEYKPGDIQDTPKTRNKRIVLLTDGLESDVNLNRMVDVFKRVIPSAVETINLNEMDIRGGCLGCVKCGHANECVYTDDVRPVYQDKLMTADAIVFAGTIRHRFLSARWKMFFDRWFFNGHCPKLQGRKAGFIISGPLRQIPNMRQTLEGKMNIWKLFSTGFVSDEYSTSKEITALIKKLAADLIWAMENDADRPETFLGGGGRKVFRDFIYKTKFVFRADHLFYKENKYYDFPQKELRARLFNTIFPPLMKIPPVRKNFQKNLTRFMFRPYERFTQWKS